METKVNDAINNYYKLKNQYDENFYDKYVKKIVVSNRSKREKKAAFATLPKPKCINCKRNVGSIFTIKHDPENEYHVYTALCGDVSKPCPLNIKILMSNTTTINEILEPINSSSGEINKLKIKIINAKNNLLFGYIQEKPAFALFETLTTDLKDKITTNEFFLNDYVKTVDSLEQRQTLQKNKIEFATKVQEFKNRITEFEKTKNPQIIHSAVEYYTNDISPQAKEIRNLTYAYNSVEYIDNNYVLIQKKNTIEQLEIDRSDPVVESYVVGMKNVQKTVSNKESKKNAKSKTKKQKPTLVLNEEPTEVVDEVTPPKTKSVNTDLFKDIFGEDSDET